MIEGTKHMFPDVQPLALEKNFNVIDAFDFRRKFLVGEGVKRIETQSSRVKFIRDMASRWSMIRNTSAHPQSGRQYTDSSFNILDFIAFAVTISHFWPST